MGSSSVSSRSRSVSPSDERHDRIQQAGGLPRIDERKNVRVLQLGGDADLAEKALAGHRREDRRAQHLDGHLPAELPVPGQKDDGHAAAADFPLQGVALTQLAPEPLEQIAHRAPSASSTPVTCGAAPTRRLWTRLSAGTLFLSRMR